MIYAAVSSVLRSRAPSPSSFPPVDAGDNREGLSAACNKFQVSRTRIRWKYQPYLGSFSVFVGAGNLLGIRYSGRILYVSQARDAFNPRDVSCREFPLVKGLDKIPWNSLGRNCRQRCRPRVGSDLSPDTCNNVARRCVRGKARERRVLSFGILSDP